jgi:hypothetical protein
LGGDCSDRFAVDVARGVVRCLVTLERSAKWLQGRERLGARHAWTVKDGLQRCWPELAADPEPIHTAPTVAAAESASEAVEEEWGKASGHLTALAHPDADLGVLGECRVPRRRGETS